MAFALVGACSIGDVDYSGRSCPCIANYYCVANRCVPNLPEGGDGGGIPDGPPPPADVSVQPSDGPMRDGAIPGDGPPEGMVDSGDGAPPSYTTIASSLGNLTALTIDSAYVYWAVYDTTSTTSTVSKAPLGGGSAGLVAMGPGLVVDLVATSQGLYFLELDGNVVLFAPGANPAYLSTASCTGVSDLATDGTYVYWSCQQTTTATLFRAASGSLALSLASGSYTGQGLAVSGTTLYVANEGANVLQVPTGGGSLTPFGTYLASFLAADTLSLYTAYNHNNASGDSVFDVTRYPFAGGGPIMLGQEAGRARDLVTDGTNVYCADSLSGLWRFGINPVSTTLIGGSIAIAAAVDSTFVYWADNGVGGGSILKAPK